MKLITLVLGMVVIAVVGTVFGTDWTGILTNKTGTPHPEYQSAMNRLEGPDIPTAQAEVAELDTLYQSNPELRPMISRFLYLAVTARTFLAPSTNDSVTALQPIIPTLTTHLTDPDPQTRLWTMRVLAMLNPPPTEALNPLISLLGSETDDENMRVASAAVARYCTTYNSKAAVAALANAAGPAQLSQKRALILGIIGVDLTKCTDPAFVDVLAAGLRSNDENVVTQAAQSAARFGAAARPLMADLQRIATTGQGRAGEAARETLHQLQLQQQR
jgi:hypothetical protein